MDIKALAVVPARGGSKSIKLKNLAPLCGRGLIEYTFEAAKGSELLDRVVLSTDSEQIAAVARACGVEVPFMRPAELAGDDCPTLPVIRHAVEFLQREDDYRPDYIVILQPTSPLRTARHIDEALTLLIDSGADSVVSVIEVPHQFNPCSVMELQDDRLVPFMPDSEQYNLRQHKPVFYARNGAAVYAFRYETLFEKNSIYGDDCRPYFMSPDESVDIDEPLDLEIAELLLTRREAK